MEYDYSAGGRLHSDDTGKKTFLVDPKTNFDSASSFAKGSSRNQKTSPGGVRSDVLNRWRKDGAIGRAVRRGKFDLLRAAILKAKAKG